MDEYVPTFAIPDEWEEIEEYLHERLRRSCRLNGPFAIDIVPAGLERRPRFRLTLPIPGRSDCDDLMTVQVLLHPDYQ